MIEQTIEQKLIKSLQQQLRQSKQREKQLNLVIINLSANIERLSNRPQQDFVSKVEEQVNRLIKPEQGPVVYRKSRDKSAIMMKQNSRGQMNSQVLLIDKPHIKDMMSNLLKVKNNLMYSTDR